MSRRVPCWLPFLSAMVLWSASARAEDDDAKTAFDHGLRAFREQRFAEAAESYERSASVRPHPASLVNAAEAWERDGNFVRATRACDRALALELDAPERARIEERRTRLLRLVGTVELKSTEPLSVRLDEGEVIRPPVLVRLSPGVHRLALVNLETHVNAAREVSIGAGERQTIDLSTPPPPRESPPPNVDVLAVRPKSSGPPTAAWIVFGVAGAAVVPVVVIGAMTASARSS